MRSKEFANDYRYFPEPDLPPLIVPSDLVESIRTTMPEMPAARRARYVRDFGLTDYVVGVLTQEQDRTDKFEELLTDLTERNPSEDIKVLAKKAADFVVTEMVRKSNETGQPLSSISISVSGLILSANIQRLISAATVKEIFHGPPISLQEAENKIKEHAQVSDEAAIAEACDKVLAAESAKLAEYRAGRDKLYGFFVGAVMKAMGGKGNPKVVNEVLRRKLAT